MNQPEDNDNNPFSEIAKIFQEMQRQLINQLQHSDAGEPNTRRFGFSIHMGPDGVPHITPIQHSHGSVHDEGTSQDPFTDAFFIEDTKTYQITAELPGMTKEDLDFEIDGDEFSFKASNGQQTFEKSMLLKYDLDPSTLKFEVRNGVLDASIKITA